MSIKDILLLGDERLYRVCDPVEEQHLEQAGNVLQDLSDTMGEFRRKYGFGRAIAAPQIGAPVRIIYLNTGEMTIGFINPQLHFPDDAQFELWDDCMSFPGLEVRLLRYKKVVVTYKDSNWNDCEIRFEGDLAELIQHEYDHLDGILAVQRAIDDRSFRINREKAQCF